MKENGNSVGKQENPHPVVSVIIPVYNVAPYLREALDSVVSQTYQNLEIVVVDDGSTDGSGEICDEYKGDPRITVIHQPNRGPSNARNTALDLATGDFIAFLDSDDAYHPEFIQRMLNAIGDADVVECAFMNYQLTLNTKGEIESKANEGFYDRKQALRGLIYVKFSTVVWNKLYRKELWQEIRFPEGHFYEDDEVVYNIFDQIKQLYYLDQPLCFYRRRMNSTTLTFNHKTAEDRNLSYDHIIAFVKNHLPEIFNEADLYRVQKSRMVVMSNFYAKGAADTRLLQASCEDIDPRTIGLRGKLAYYMIRWCPWPLKVFYPTYMHLRMLVLRVFHR